VAEGDTIRVDVRNHTIDLLVDESTLEARRADWKLPEPRYTSGVLAKYAALAQGADMGAITRP
jgi:dihydroxy-acid dehydratase